MVSESRTWSLKSPSGTNPRGHAARPRLPLTKASLITVTGPEVEGERKGSPNYTGRGAKNGIKGLIVLARWQTNS